MHAVTNRALRRSAAKFAGTYGLFFGLSRDDRKKTIANVVNEVEITSDEVVSKVFVNRVAAGDSFIIECLDGSKTLISNLLERASANASRLPGRNGGNGPEWISSKKVAIVSFLNILEDKVSDEIPNKLERHLPYGNTLPRQ